MPPMPGQKGTVKKGRDVRQSASRNTTPSHLGASSSVPPPESGETALLELPSNKFQTADEIVEQYGSSIPTSKELEGLLKELARLAEVVEQRGVVCDRGMRILAQSRNQRLEDLEAERREAETKERIKKEAADGEERGRNRANKAKKRKDRSTIRDEKPLLQGAHSLAPQDRTNLESSPIRDPTARKASHRDNDSASSSLSPVAVATPATGMDVDEKDDTKMNEDEETSSDEHQPAAPTVPHHQTFGDDPSTFPDPTVYEVRKCYKDMPDDLRREWSSVAVFPREDLEDKIPGVAPDKDFSNGKVTNQVQANTFVAYLEPYFRPYTEEDLAFLRERGDRTTPFVIPRRGKKHYTDVWAEEDGSISIDTPSQGKDKLPPNQARGNIDDIDDAIAETDQVSAGPILSRLLATMRPEHRATASEEKPTTNGIINGEANMNGEANGDFSDLNQILGVDTPAPIPPATYMPESSSEFWKKAIHPKLDHAQVDERIKQELRHIGFLPPDAEPDYEAHYDDEIAARIRYLQAQLKDTMIINAARKARLQDLVKERMAHQEYTTILEDLDGQVQTAYLKRTRTMGKSKKNKRPGGAGGGSHFVGNAANGMARPGIGDMTKTLMERRSKWIDSIGTVFDNERSIVDVPRATDPESSIFKPEDMVQYTKREREMWDEDNEEE